MNSKPIAIASVWGISVAAAFFAGKAISPSANESVETIQAAKSTASIGNEGSSNLVSTGGSTTSMASARARLDAAPMIERGSTPEQMIEDIARFDDAIERNNALLALIDSLSPDEFLSVVDSFRQLGITDERRGEYEMLLTAWAKVNPSEALAYASENTRGGFARNTILSTWAATNPDAAIAWAESNHDNPDRANPWLVGVIEGIAPYDISRATDLMETLPRSEQRGEALRSVLSQLMSKDPEDAKNWTSTIEDDYLRSGAAAYTAEAIARKDPADAAQWLASLGDVDALNRAGEDITEDWYRDNPEEATAWISTLPPEAMSEAAEGVVSNIVRENPVEAAEYLSQLATSNPDANFDSAIRDLVRGAGRSDPELAAIWVGGLSNSDDQSRYYHRVLGDWKNRDSGAAEQWMIQNEASLPESIGRRFLGRPDQNNGGQ
ncbi:MAG: hypothetical protein ACSHYB_04635 [Roseibacillus sp.]